MKPKQVELDQQIAALLRQLADLHEQRAKAQDTPPEDTRKPTGALSCVALGAMIGVCSKTISRRAKDGLAVKGYYVERVSDRLFRLVPAVGTKPVQPKEREGLRRMRILQSAA